MKKSLKQSLEGLETFNVYILDQYYEIWKGRPVVINWAKTDKGKIITFYDDTQNPYLYSLEHPDIKKLPTRVVESIRNIEKVDKMHEGEPITVWKIETDIPGSVPGLEKALGAENTSDSGIYFSFRYGIDKGLLPCRWYKIKVKDDKLVSHKPIERDPPPLKIMSLDIECWNIGGIPQSGEQAIVTIVASTCTMRWKEGIASTSKRKFRDFIAEGKKAKDGNMLIDFLEYIHSYDPDILITYNGINFDIQYIWDRCKKLDIPCLMSRDGKEPRHYQYGIIQINGRVHLDMLLYARGYLVTENRKHGLKDVARYVLKKPIKAINTSKIPEIWNKEGGKQIILKYNREDTDRTMDIAEQATPFIITMSSVCGVNPNQCLSISTGNRYDHFRMSLAAEDGYIIPNRVKTDSKKESFGGARVLKSVIGLHDNIACLDFASMYPNIIINKNISIDTFVEFPKQEELEDLHEIQIEERTETSISSKTNYFRKEPESIDAKAMKILMKARTTLKDKWQIIAIKDITSTGYGYYGWGASRWYKRECAESITAIGREATTTAVEIAEDMGLNVLHGHTDSIFVPNKPAKIRKFQKIIKKKLDLDIKVDNIFPRIFFTNARSRWAGINDKGEITIKGFEKIRGGLTWEAQDTQGTVFDILFHAKKDVAPEIALIYVRGRANMTLRGEMPKIRLRMRQSLKKDIDDYKVNTKMISLTKQLRELGHEVKPGAIIDYVVVKGKGKLLDKVKPYDLTKYDEMDLEWYALKQVLIPSCRVLAYLWADMSQCETKKDIDTIVRNFTKSIYSDIYADYHTEQIKKTHYSLVDFV